MASSGHLALILSHTLTIYEAGNGTRRYTPNCVKIPTLPFAPQGGVPGDLGYAVRTAERLVERAEPGADVEAKALAHKVKMPGRHQPRVRADFDVDVETAHPEVRALLPEHG